MQKFANDMTRLVEKIRLAASARHGSLRESRTATRSLLQRNHAQRCRNGQHMHTALQHNRAELRQTVRHMTEVARAARCAIGADIREAERIWRKG
jgi:hypothetical protein